MDRKVVKIVEGSLYLTPSPPLLTFYFSISSCNLKHPLWFIYQDEETDLGTLLLTYFQTGDFFLLFPTNVLFLFQMQSRLPYCI